MKAPKFAAYLLLGFALVWSLAGQPTASAVFVVGGAMLLFKDEGAT